MVLCVFSLYRFFFFFNDTATTEIYTLSLHDALPICNSDAVGRAIATLARDPDLRARLGSNARRRAEHLTWQHSVDSVLACYSSLLLAPGASLEPA